MELRNLIAFLIYAIIFVLGHNFALGQTTEIQRIRYDIQAENVLVLRFGCSRATDEPLNH